MADETQTANEPGAAPARTLIPLVLPQASFTDPAAAFRTFPLTNAVTVDGRSFAAVGIRRFTVGQVAAITDNFRANLALDPDARMSLPLYVDEAGQDLPQAVLDLITPDEMEDLDKAAADFLPRRFRAGLTPPEADTPPPPAGSTTAPSS